MSKTKRVAVIRLNPHILILNKGVTVDFIKQKFNEWAEENYPGIPPKRVMGFLGVMTISIISILLIAFYTLAPIVGNIAILIVAAMAWVVFKRSQYLHQLHIEKKGDQQ